MCTYHHYHNLSSTIRRAQTKKENTKYSTHVLCDGWQFVSGCVCACFLFSSSSYMPCRHQCSTKNTHMHILATQYWQKFFVKSVLVCLTQPLARCQRRRQQLAICMWAHKKENGKNVAFSDVCECASVWYGGSCLFVSFGGRLNLPAPTTVTQKQERLKCKQSTDTFHLLLPPHRLINM